MYLESIVRSLEQTHHAMLGPAVRPLHSAGPVNGLLTATRSLRIRPSRNISFMPVRQPNNHDAPAEIPLPTTTSSLDPSGRRQFSASARRPRDHHFDTLKFVQRLKDDGFTEEQAVAMMKVLSDVIEERSPATSHPSVP